MRRCFAQCASRRCCAASIVGPTSFPQAGAGLSKQARAFSTVPSSSLLAAPGFAGVALQRSLALNCAVGHRSYSSSATTNGAGNGGVASPASPSASSVASPESGESSSSFASGAGGGDADMSDGAASEEEGRFRPQTLNEPTTTSTPASPASNVEAAGEAPAAGQYSSFASGSAADQVSYTHWSKEQEPKSMSVSDAEGKSKVPAKPEHITTNFLRARDPVKLRQVRPTVGRPRTYGGSSFATPNIMIPVVLGTLLYLGTMKPPLRVLWREWRESG